MLNITERFNKFNFSSGKLLIESYYDEMSILSDSGTIDNMDVTIIDMSMFTIVDNILINRLFIEFILYLVYLNEIPDDVDDIFIEYCSNNGIKQGIRYIDYINDSYENISNMLSLNMNNPLLFVGWLDGRQYDIGYLTSYRYKEEDNSGRNS